MASKSSQRRKLIRLSLIWLVISLLGSTLYLTGTFSSADRLAMDNKFLLFQREYERDDIALVTIDASSLDRFSRQFNLHWPWPREIYGMLLEYLGDAGAETVTFDILFDRPDIDRLDAEGPVSDRRFADAIHNYGKTIIAASSQTVGNSHSSDNSQPAEISPSAGSDNAFELTDYPGLERHFIPLRSGFSEIPHATPVNIPIEPFRYAADRIGNAYIPTRHDGVIRFAYLLMPVAGQQDQQIYFPSLPLAGLLTKNGDHPADTWFLDSDYLDIGDVRIPLQQDGTYRINWYSRGGVNDGTFPYYSFYDVFRSAFVAAQNRLDQAPLSPDNFKGKHIIIGASAAGLGDIKTTPFSALEPYPGMEIQATVLANLLDESFIGEISDRLVISILWLLMLPVIFGIGNLRHVNSIVLAIVTPLLIIGTGFALFAVFRFIVPTVFFTGISILGIGTTYVYRYLTEERQKKAMKSAFSQYVQKEFVDRIADDPEQLKLGGQKKELTVLFSDMANFTTISEKLTPEKLSELLNIYLTDMTRILFEHGGTLDKFIGDAVMAFWSAPIDQPDHAIRACRCALAMQQRLEERAAEWEKAGYPPIKIRIGINTGPMIVGNMGSNERFNYTVLGDAVNLGARLEPLNKQYGTDVILSEFTLESIRKWTASSHNPDRLPEVRELDRITVKGKSEAVTIYELVSMSAPN